MSGFFKYFPTLFHSNTAATNIIARVKFEESVKNNLAVFLPYQISEGQRPDQIAEGVEVCVFVGVCVKVGVGV